MTMTLCTPSGPVVISDCAVLATNRFSDVIAVRTVAVLRCCGVSLPLANSKTLPAWYLLELGALTVLVDWQSQGLIKPEWGLPSSAEASDEIIRRWTTADNSGISNTPLKDKVFQVWLQYFAWSAPDLLGSQVTIDSGDEDALVDQLAHFLLDIVRGEAATRKEDTPDVFE